MSLANSGFRALLSSSVMYRDRDPTSNDGNDDGINKAWWWWNEPERRLFFCVDAEDGTAQWMLVGTETSSGDFLYTNPTPMPTTVGGLDAGSTFFGVSLQELFDSLLYVYQPPLFTAFGFAQTSPIEVGQSILGGSKAFLWADTNPANVEPNTIDIWNQTSSVQIADNLPDTGLANITIGGVTRSTPSTQTWRIIGTNTRGATFYRDFSVQWLSRVFHGASLLSTLGAPEILTLPSNALRSGAAADYAMGTGGYKYICYPSTMGLRTSFKDTLTNLDVAMETPYTVSVTNPYGVTQVYYVHRTTNILGASLTIRVA